MAIKQEHTDLPRQIEGNPPEPVPIYGPLLAQAWADAYVDESDRPMAVAGARVRASWAGKCARDIAYRMRGVAKSNPPDLAGHWRMGIGTMVHERLQAVFTTAFAGAQVEYLVGWPEILEAEGASSIDEFLVVTPGNDADTTAATRTVIEVKTINGFGFKKIIGARGTAEGPRTGALLQGAVSAVAAQADELVILYLSLECLSDRELLSIGGGDATRKFIAEWRYTPEQFAPIALREGHRLKVITERVDGGQELPPRHIPFEMPSGATIVDVRKGVWRKVVEGNILDAGTTWMCGYCDYRDHCATELEAGV